MSDEFENERAKLLELRDELRRRASALDSDTRKPLEADFAEQAVTLENRDVQLALGEEARVELVQIERALMLMDSGEYGTCVNCGDAIARERLSAYPMATRCIRCAEARGD